MVGSMGSGAGGLGVEIRLGAFPVDDGTEFLVVGGSADGVASLVRFAVGAG